MYIIKNALRCISRSKGRNVLIGIIVFVIAVSACIGLSIRQAAESAKQETLETLSVTATISFDRRGAMSNLGTPPSQSGQGMPSFDRDQFSQMMGNESALTLDQYQTYAGASTVKDFTYQSSVSINGNDELLPVSSESESVSTESSSSSQNGFGGFGGMMGGFGGMMGGGKNQIFGSQSDFTLIGYSSEKAMTSFQEGTASIPADYGTVFTESTEEYECIISEELATYNSLAVGDTITLTNPNNEEETYDLTVTGIYVDTSANENSFSMMGMTSNDPANQIYMSYNALAKIIESSAANSTTETDENTGREFETALKDNLSATYYFANVEDYETFCEEVYTLGLEEDYTVSSSDITAFENSLTPLNTLSETAGYFLIVILLIGAVILIVLNIFNVRERKYEIGVLTAMGMKKGKVALQFMTEIFVITLITVIIGAAIGAVSSVPVTNSLLANQTAGAEQRFENIEQNFGRGEMPNMPNTPDMSEGSGGKGGFGGMMGGFMGGVEDVFNGAANYITEIDSATNLIVIVQMLGIAVLLTVVSGAASMLFIMRYEPLKILSNRD